MYDNLNPTHTHTAHTTNNECQKVIEMKEHQYTHHIQYRYKIKNEKQTTNVW